MSPPTSDALAVEEPLEIRIRGKALVVTMRTPGHDPALAAGYLWSEGLIRQREQFIDAAHCQRGEQLDGNILNVFLREDVVLDEERSQRFTYAASGCGLCGKASIDSIRSLFPPVPSKSTMRRTVLQSMLDALKHRQEVFTQTGGLHAAARFSFEGTFLGMMEDVGRHNAVDKLIGAWLLDEGIEYRDQVLFVTSRASFEIVQKALAARIPVIAFASAPSSLAVEFAEANGQTLIGFLREDRFNIYTHPERLLPG